MKDSKIPAILLIFVIIVSGCTQKQNTNKQTKGVEGEITGVTDGDTYSFTSTQGEKYTVRLEGVDTPETYQENSPRYWACNLNKSYLKDWGYKATDFATQKFNQTQAEMIKKETGPYGRQIAKLNVQYQGEEKSISRILLENGYATTYNPAEFPEKQEYLNLEEKVREERKGLWQAC